MNNPALSALRHHVSGAIKRGEAVAIVEKPALVSLDMLEVINPNASGKDYCKRYINGRRVSAMRWDLANCHAQAKECFITTDKRGKWYRRYVVRTAINFAK